jgi:hypothetical protein
VRRHRGRHAAPGAGPARVRRHCLYHADLTRYLADQRRLAEEQRFSNLEGQARPAGPGPPTSGTGTVPSKVTSFP